MKYTLGFSPCPNDTFIFDALVNKNIDTKGIQLEVVLADVQTLNEWALQEKLSFSKISYGVWPLVKNNYQLLQSGSALGNGVGPLLIAKKIISETDINNGLIAIPGKNTTAHLLFSLAYPAAKFKVFKVFHDIEEAVLQGEVIGGVIIHENRFTYEQKGLVKISDLGVYWEQQLQLPIPLGGIVASNKIASEIVQQVDELINDSLQYAFTQYPAVSKYVKEHAQEMSEAVMRQHIDLYVNDYSLQLGAKGHEAIKKLEEVYSRM